MHVSAPWLQLPQFILLLPAVTWKHSLGKTVASKYVVYKVNALLCWIFKLHHHVLCSQLKCCLSMLFICGIVNLLFVRHWQYLWKWILSAVQTLLTSQEREHVICADCAIQGHHKWQISSGATHRVTNKYQLSLYRQAWLLSSKISGVWAEQKHYSYRLQYLGLILWERWRLLLMYS